MTRDEQDRAVLSHVRRYPGLPVQDITRALHLAPDPGPSVKSRAAQGALNRLEELGLIRHEDTPTHRGVRRLWYPAQPR